MHHYSIMVCVPRSHRHEGVAAALDAGLTLEDQDVLLAGGVVVGKSARTEMVGMKRHSQNEN